MRVCLKRNKGFTLVEILVVMVIMGLVIASILTLFTNTQRTANTSEEVVDVQQNLRVALETIAADIRMAGFLVPGGTSAIESTPGVLPVALNSGVVTTDPFTLNTVSSTRSYVRIEEVVSTSPLKIEVPGGMLRNLKKGDFVNIINHTNGSDVRVVDLEVKDIDEGDSSIEFNSNALNISPRDLVVRKLENEDGTIIRYWLRSGNGGQNNLQLMRTDSSDVGDGSVIASNITSVVLEYFDRNGVVAVNPEDVRSVRVVIVGQTDESRTGSDRYSGLKTRALSTTVALRNIN